MLARPVVGHSFRIHPKTKYVRITLRMELYGYGPLTDAVASLNLDAEFGCIPVLGEGLGVEDGSIPNSRLTSSSIRTSGTETHKGRLNTVGGVWAADSADNNTWVKVNLGKDTLVTGVITQGWRHNKPLSFQISYSRDDKNWTFALEEHCGVRKTYAGPFDTNTYVTIVFPEPVTTQYVRFHPISSLPAMRFEVLGIKTRTITSYH
ncbi:lactadherin-like [Strongylocentrotus purpuratus]|uniref:F5/8 type C domain-containing protein n=1 Tax=Strongylocentrotus purpuratus TaxID=7668 RepID=A0A7M7NYT7_STRPU|nr:lactadherin-like [Strongylocentrotus purpuratus]